MPLAVPPVFALGHTIPFALSLSKGFVLAGRHGRASYWRGDTEGFD